MSHFDMLVIGSGPAGQKAAIQAAKLGKKVGLIERKNQVGGVCTNTGTIPSKSLREAVLYLSGFHQRALYGSSYRVKQDITMEDLSYRANHVIRREIEIIHNQMSRNNIQLLTGTAAFLDPHRLHIEGPLEQAEHSADRHGDRRGDAAQGRKIAISRAEEGPSSISFSPSRSWS